MPTARNDGLSSAPLACSDRRGGVAASHDDRRSPWRTSDSTSSGPEHVVTKVPRGRVGLRRGRGRPRRERPVLVDRGGEQSAVAARRPPGREARALQQDRCAGAASARQGFGRVRQVHRPRRCQRLHPGGGLRARRHHPHAPAVLRRSRASSAPRTRGGTSAAWRYASTSTARVCSPPSPRATSPLEPGGAAHAVRGGAHLPLEPVRPHQGAAARRLPAARGGGPGAQRETRRTISRRSSRPRSRRPTSCWARVGRRTRCCSGRCGTPARWTLRPGARSRPSRPRNPPPARAGGVQGTPPRLDRSDAQAEPARS